MIKSIKNWTRAAILGLSLVVTPCGTEETPGKMDFQTFSSEGQERVNRRIALCNYTVPIQNMSENSRIKILHISDIHFGISNHKVQDVLDLAEKVNHLNPDFVVYTGDLAHSDYSDINDEVVDALSRVCPKSRKFFVLGNHDYYHNKHACKEAAIKVAERLEEAGLENLTNSKRKMVINGQRINFYGMDDYRHGTPSSPDLSTSEEGETNVLLVHNLDSVKRKDIRGLDLVLSGHLHGGEISFAGYSGVDFLIGQGMYFNLNNQKKGWKKLSQRTYSYISPGFSTRNPMGIRVNVEKAGASVITLNGRIYD